MVPVILVVDEETKIRQLVRAYLEREGYTVVEAGTGAAALERAAAVDLMILDLGLPDRAGHDVARQLRRSVDVPRTPRPAAGATPIGRPRRSVA